jgi:hypothetical protein
VAPGDPDEQYPGAPVSAPHFTIDVLSRGTHPIENGSSFPFLDPQLGELGLGDLTALVGFEGQRLPRGPLKLEWTMDGQVMDSKAVMFKREPGAKHAELVEYGNEPSPGSYRITLKLKDREVQSFNFRITR